MSACSSQPEMHVLEGIVPPTGIPLRLTDGRIVLERKLVERQSDHLVLEGVTIQSLADWADGVADTDWMLPVFWGLARAFKNPVVGEIGYRHGVSAIAWCLAARQCGGKVYSMDIEECWAGRRNLYRTGLSDVHTFIHGDSAACEFPEPLDILFVDGDHSYQGVSLDFQAHRGSVKPGGLMLFHDPVSCPGVGEFCREIGAAILPMGAGLAVLPC